MRRIRPFLAFLALLAGGCPGGNVAPGSQPDNCSAGTATLTSLALANYQSMAPAAVGDRWIPGSGGQGLPMAHFDLVLTGSVPDCLNVNARAQNAIFDGNIEVLTTATGGIIDLLVGPVGDSFDIFAQVAGHSAHVTIVSNVVTGVD